MDARELLTELAAAGVTVAVNGDALAIRPASRLTDDLRARLRAAKPELLARFRPVAPAWWGWDDPTIARFVARRGRLMRWGWSEPEAEALAERLTRRDAEADDRVSCAECRHYRPGHCGNHKRAGLMTGDVGHDLTRMLQRCPGWQSER